jgi:hypothetical protein
MLNLGTLVFKTTSRTAGTPSTPAIVGAPSNATASRQAPSPSLSRSLLGDAANGNMAERASTPWVLWSASQAGNVAAIETPYATLVRTE